MFVLVIVIVVVMHCTHDTFAQVCQGGDAAKVEALKLLLLGKCTDASVCLHACVHVCVHA